MSDSFSQTTPDVSNITDLRQLGFEYRLVPHTAKHTIGESTAHSNCWTRLFHIESNTMIDSKNRSSKFIPDGPFFEKVAQVAQQVAIHEYLIPQFDLKSIILEENSASEKLSALLCSRYNDPSGSNSNKATKTFIFITGKGLSRAGIISVKELIESGIERGSVYYFLLKARQRQWNTIFVDPNALGTSFGMKAVEKSLDVLLSSHSGPLYILAHSAAGGYLVRYLLDKHDPKINGIVFTDSTHRIAWARRNRNLEAFLQSPRCLYIRNNALGNPFALENANSDRLPGELAITNEWWEQRFGTIRTVWGGTVDHSALCWKARDVIWNFFDEIDRRGCRGEQKAQEESHS